MQSREKGAGSAASHLWSCGNMARDVLPWQPSSTDPLMGCLVCQCDSCWTVWRMCMCASTVGLYVRKRNADRKRETEWQRHITDRMVWGRRANHLITLFCNCHCGGELSSYYRDIVCISIWVHVFPGFPVALIVENDFIQAIFFQKSDMEYCMTDTKRTTMFNSLKRKHVTNQNYTFICMSLLSLPYITVYCR